MKAHALGLVLVGAITIMPVSSQTKKTTQTASVPESAVPLAHVRNRFELTVQAPYEIAAPLFGPLAERSWAGEDWDPQFIYPHPPKDREGAVFSVRHGSHQSIWVNTAFDMKDRHFQYVYFVSDVMVTVIDLRFLPLDSAKTKVSVVYERTALSPEANDHVEKLGSIDRGTGKQWEKAVNDYLRKKPT
jgi:hypothetical protein